MKRILRISLLLFLSMFPLVGCSTSKAVQKIGVQQTTPASSISPALYDRTSDGLYRINAVSGKALWHAETPIYNDNFTSSPALLWKNSVYLLGTYSDGYYLYAFNADNGALRWKYRYGGADLSIDEEDHPGSVLFGAGTIYIVAGSNSYATAGPQLIQGGGIRDIAPSIIYALNPGDGSLQWKRSPGYRLNDPVLSDGNIYGIGSTTMHGSLYALKGSDGSPLWQQPLPQTSDPFFSFQVDSGILYYVELNDDVTLYARSIQDGHMIWQVHEPAHGTSGPITVTNGLLYYIVNSQDLYALQSKNGSLAWKRTIPGLSNPRILVNGGQLYLLVQVDLNKPPIKLLTLNASSGQNGWVQVLPQGLIQSTLNLYISGDRLYLQVADAPSTWVDKIFLMRRAGGTPIKSYEIPYDRYRVSQLTLQP